MELTAVPSETATIPTGMAIFMEHRENAIRMFDQPPAHWGRNQGKEVLTLNSTAFVGEYFVFQAGIFANTAGTETDLTNISVTFGGADAAANPATSSSSSSSSHSNGGTSTAPSSSANIPPSAMTCFNLGGNDQNGIAFSKDFAIGAGRVGALWFGVDLGGGQQPFAASPGTYTSTIKVAANGGQYTKQLVLQLVVTMPSNGKPVRVKNK